MLAMERVDQPARTQTAGISSNSVSFQVRMACDLPSDNNTTNGQFVNNDMQITDEEHSIKEELPNNEMEQEVVISMPNSAATTMRARPSNPFSQVNVTGLAANRDQLIVDETEFMTQKTNLVQMQAEIAEEIQIEGATDDVPDISDSQ